MENKKIDIATISVSKELKKELDFIKLELQVKKGIFISRQQVLLELIDLYKKNKKEE